MRKYWRLLKAFTMAAIRTEAHLARLTAIAYVEHIDRLQSAYKGGLRLEPHGFKVYSQGDEDGQLQEIFRRIGTTDRRFIEIGVGEGSENNTAYLLHQGWSGVWIDHPSYATGIAANWPAQTAAGKLKFIGRLVDPDGVDDALRDGGISGDIDLLGLDIDGNDFHVLRRISLVRPRVICVEYNASFPPPYEWIMPYNAAHRYVDGSNYFGASLSAFEKLMRDKGYSLVGCGLTGANAFFVRADLAAGKFAEPLTAEHLYQPARYYLSLWHPAMRQGFLTGWMPPQLLKDAG